MLCPPLHESHLSRTSTLSRVEETTARVHIAVLGCGKGEPGRGRTSIRHRDPKSIMQLSVNLVTAPWPRKDEVLGHALH